MNNGLWETAVEERAISILLELLIKKKTEPLRDACGNKIENKKADLSGIMVGRELWDLFSNE